MFVRRSSSTMYRMPSKTKTKSKGLKEYQNYGHHPFPSLW